MIFKSPIEMIITSWLLASLIFDSIWQLKNKILSHEIAIPDSNFLRFNRLRAKRDYT